MFSKQEVKSNLIGCAEIFLFMRSGLERFVVSPGAAIKSFIIPVFLMPLSLYVAIVMSETCMLPSVLVLLHVVRMVASLGLYLLAVYFIAKQYHREGHFYRFLVIFNWMNIVGLVYLLPIAVGLLAGYPINIFENYAIFITLTSYVYLAFVLTHCFRLPWEMGGFIAIVGLAIDDNLLKIVEAIQNASIL